MAYVNNGIARSLRVSVTKKLGGVIVQGYPKTYDGQNYWGDPLYPTLTDTQFRQLSDLDFLDRYTAFFAYVEFMEPGCDFDYDVVGTGVGINDASCLATTTTTTAAVVETTTTTSVPVKSLILSLPDSGYSSVDLCGYTINTAPPVLMGSTVQTYFKGFSSTPGNYIQLYSDPNCTTPWYPAAEYSTWAGVLHGETAYSIYDITVTLSGIKNTHWTCV